MLRAFVVLLVLPIALSGQQLEIHHIDVNQGDATLFVMPAGQTLLVDAGLSGAGEFVAGYLDSLGISQLDAFVATHYDSDHIGGVDRLVQRGIGVSSFHDRGRWDLTACEVDEDGRVNEPQLCQYQQTVQAETDSAVALDPGDQLVLDSAVSVVVVASNARVHRHDPSLSAEENSLSVALMISYKGFNYLLGGDITEVVERRMVAEARVGDLDVYHVNHHGSESSSNPAFLRLIRPEVAVISAGSNCRYDHPRQSVLDSLKAAVPGVEIFQTNKYDCTDGPGGNVADEAIGDLHEPGAEGSIVISVGDEDYTVVLLRTGGGMLLPIERLE